MDEYGDSVDELTTPSNSSDEMMSDVEDSFDSDDADDEVRFLLCLVT